MLHYVHQLLSDCVRLMFAAVQVQVYSGFLQLLINENNAVKALRVNKNSEVSGWTDNQSGERHYNAP